jgi:tRNA(Met) C34 N-acetyltransferase TmcA
MEADSIRETVTHEGVYFLLAARGRGASRSGLAIIAASAASI